MKLHHPMEYTIQANPDQTILITIDDAREEIPILVDEFRKCTTENCGCQSDETRKIDFIQIEEYQEGIKVYFSPKQGEAFDLEKMEDFVVEVLSYAYLKDGEEEIHIQIDEQISDQEQ